MPESQELKNALNFIASGQKEKALPLLWKLYTSKNSGIKLTAGMNLLTVLDLTTENKKLLDVTDETIELASAMGKKDIRIYLLSKKAIFVYNDLTYLTSRQRNLNLAAGVFHWIDFSLEKDQKEYEAIIAQKDTYKKEISSLEADVLASIQSIEDHNLRGHIFMSLGEISFTRFLNDQLDLMICGRLRSKIINYYFVRRWNLNILLGFDRNAQRKIRKSRKMCISYFEKSIKEFKVGHHEINLAYAFYNLAAKFTLMYCFSKARRYLNKARQLAEMRDEKALLVKINELGPRIKDKYKDSNNYVREQKLNLPRHG